VDPETPLLWVVRERLGLTGTKFGCGVEECGACTMHIDGEATKTCQLPAGSAQGKRITTIEGLPADHPVKLAWIAEEVPQCGYCQPGMIMAASSLLAAHPQPTPAQVDQAMDGNICRCGAYPRIRKAIRRAAEGS
ncbi:MAG TPA: (2Fe-2S)-binding protein, partial [Deferrisomatales bacterium]|nr:(2Fe-2S)-binding protein [Deferrisomatales bacterium]